MQTPIHILESLQLEGSKVGDILCFYYTVPFKIITILSDPHLPTKSKLSVSSNPKLTFLKQFFVFAKCKP